ncbi:MAG TPA: preprotein translocase subunit SecE [Ruminococcaceae bacterium]|nr:preprotein translocase subunit SecE [Oscillospiraceae bacterium]
MPKSKQNKKPIPLHPKNARSAKNIGKSKQKGRWYAFKHFWSDIHSEFKKIVWPSGHQLFINTVVVLVTMAVVGALVMALDALCVTGFNALVK